MALTRRAYLVIFAVIIACVAAGAVYLRYRVNKAIAECDTPALPSKPVAAPPKLPGFQTEAACGPGETASPAPAQSSPGAKK